MKVFGLAGYSHSGKTTLITRLIEHFSRRGVSCAAIKHASPSFDADIEGKDSHRMRRAGARHVVIASSRRVVQFDEIADRDRLDELIRRLSGRDCELLLVEGFKTQNHPKLQIGEQRVEGALAIVSDRLEEAQFRRDDIELIADFVLAHAMAEKQVLARLAEPSP